MKKNICFAMIVFATTFAQSQNKRPKITGIDHVDFYTTSPDANERFYIQTLGLAAADTIEPGQSQRFIVGMQWVGYSQAPNPKATDRLDHVALATENCASLRSYLGSKGVSVPDSLSHLKDGTLSFTIEDPEGHRIEFVERAAGQDRKEVFKANLMPDSISHRIIHVGFIVHDRTAEDHFYRDILGFHLYWYGGMRSDKADWVAMQVPDGTDWVEYMLNVRPDADQHTTGVMNHVSLGTKDIKQAQANLEKRGWKQHGDEKAQMGRDGKWQLNLYDPDFTRVELMEFKPVQKPCCSEFQGKHPSD